MRNDVLRCADREGVPAGYILRRALGARPSLRDTFSAREGSILTFEVFPTYREHKEKPSPERGRLSEARSGE